MKDKALFGPAGNSERFYAEGYKRTAEAMKWLKDNSLDAYEYQCGNGVRTTDKTLNEVRDSAIENSIVLSLHAPYYISLSGVETEKRLKSIEYISQSIHAAQQLGADRIVVHTGSAAKITRGEAMSLASDTITKTLETIGQTGITICLETMGKINQLGTLDEVIELCSIDDSLSPCVDFGHLNARGVGGVFKTTDDYRRVFDRIGEALSYEKAKYLHCHFSKIEYTSAGEKKHLTFEDKEFGPEFEPLIEAIIRDSLCPRIICESSGTMADDAMQMKKYYEGKINGQID